MIIQDPASFVSTVNEMDPNERRGSPRTRNFGHIASTQLNLASLTPLIRLKYTIELY